MAVGSTGISPSRGSLATAPIACDGFTVEMPLITLGLWLDGSIVSPIAGRRRGGSHPPVIADCLSLPAMQIVAQPLMWLMLITIAIGMCLMNGYSVVKEQTHSPHKTENRQRVFVPLHLFPHLKAICVVQAQKFLKNFLSFSTAMSTLNFTARLVHPSIPAICS